MRLRDLVELTRAPAALSVPGDVVAGAAASSTLDARTAGLAAASVCLYWAGMAGNDWSDRELDAVERPDRPIPSGRVTPHRALCVALGLTGAGVALAALTGGRRALRVALPLAGAVWVYDLALKNTAAGPAGMAVCRGLDVLLGASSGRLRPAARPAAVVAAHTYLVTVLSRHEVRGAPRSVPAATLVGTALVGTAAVTVAASAPGRSRGASPGLAVLLSAWYVARFGQAQRRAFDQPGADNLRAAVGAGITSLPALQGALTAAAGAPAVGALVAAAYPVARVLAKRVSPT